MAVPCCLLSPLHLFAYPASRYILRNQIVGNVEAAFKFRTTDRFMLLHNTIVNWGNAWPGDAMMCCNEDHLLRGIVRNNLWIAVQGGQIWGFDAGVIDWRTDIDYEAYSGPDDFYAEGIGHNQGQVFPHPTQLGTGEKAKEKYYSAMETSP